MSRDAYDPGFAGSRWAWLKSLVVMTAKLREMAATSHAGAATSRKFTYVSKYGPCMLPVTDRASRYGSVSTLAGSHELEARSLAVL